MLLFWLPIGFLLGAMVVAIASRVVVRRAVARERVAERRARSAEHLAEIGSMTGGLAHEIKNPLSTIGLNAQLLSEAIADLPGDQPVEEAERQRLQRRVGALRTETERLRGILEDFLEYAGEMRLHRSPTDAGALLDELADFFDAQASSSGVRLRVDRPEGAIRAALDAPLIKQALLNLMLNASDAMRDHVGDAPKELMLRLEPAEGAIWLRVVDTGPGMDEETLNQVFRPYFTTKSGGTGLGLPTARRIIEAHGGRMEVHSSPGRGTAFEITLPTEAASV